MSTLVLITGTGRSGTSTMSGTFDQLGLHVPGPYLGANESNPKGFFESKWAVRVPQDRSPRGAGINDFDSRPDAFDRAQRGRDPTTCGRSCASSSPRAAAITTRWWSRTPARCGRSRCGEDGRREVGMEICFISMLRHPAEVVGSRRRTTRSPRTPRHQRSYETFNVARWVNSSLVSERETRGRRRAFVSLRRSPDRLATGAGRPGRRPRADLRRRRGARRDPPASTTSSTPTCVATRSPGTTWRSPDDLRTRRGGDVGRPGGPRRPVTAPTPTRRPTSTSSRSATRSCSGLRPTSRTTRSRPSAAACASSPRSRAGARARRVQGRTPRRRSRPRRPRTPAWRRSRSVTSADVT